LAIERREKPFLGRCAFAEYGWTSDVGLIRAANEDAAVVGLSADGEGLLAAVADGMGGYAGGRIAADIAIDTFAEVLSYPVPPLAEDRYETLLASFYLADSRVRARTDYPSMGATAVAALITRRELLFLHAGDSRCYLIRGGSIVCRTRDHSMRELAEYADGELVGASYLSNVVTSCIGGPGQYGNLTVDPVWDDNGFAGVVDIEPNDIVFLCTDGLWNNIDDETLLEMTNSAPSDPAAILERLIDRALERGGHDNITVCVVRMLPDQVPTPG
jgi:serine/threonine protein phosphatase PrpC